jgi:hypothetical protein
MIETKKAKHRRLKMPTLAQIAPLIRLFLPFITGGLTYYAGADATQVILSLVLPLFGISAPWSLYRNTVSGLTQTVASIKDDAGKPAVKILVSSTAPQSLLALAKDDNVPEVVHAASVAPAAPPPKDPYVTARRMS